VVGLQAHLPSGLDDAEPLGWPEKELRLAGDRAGHGTEATDEDGDDDASPSAAHHLRSPPHVFEETPFSRRTQRENRRHGAENDVIRATRMSLAMAVVSTRSGERARFAFDRRRVRERACPTT